MDLTVNLPDHQKTSDWRKTRQPLLPVRKKTEDQGGYEIYPSHAVGPGKIFNGFSSLAEWIRQKRFVAIDGYAGVFWNDIKNALQQELEPDPVKWSLASDRLKSPAEINKMVSPFIGTPGSVWGKRTDLTLEQFFASTSPVHPADNQIHVIIGSGAAMLAPDAHVIYIDLPKNEIQFRMRAGSVMNFGNDRTGQATEMYKRFYFVDWVVLNEYKKSLLPRIEVLADGQWKDTINWMHADQFRHALGELGRRSFRVRPWFEPGAWGGQWMKQNLRGINKDELNYAWSFELIVPENGLVFESDGYLLEASFDFLMFSEAAAVLGKHWETFGDEFPIRFDFLDTWDGGNLSIQCHPSVDYIRKEFGERITQDETYYILDCQENANVYLGFQDDIDAGKFRSELEKSRDLGTEIKITDYVQMHRAKKHDLFLIPNGTIHSAGAGNLVLEISATPYIFTFKMYDWLRLDLNGEPRAINIEHAFNNLRFHRKGESVTKELISTQRIVKKGKDWQLVHVPTHPDHFYDVERIEFDTAVDVLTEGSCHVLMLVEGSSVSVEHTGGAENIFHYAETFVIPAAADSYRLVNAGTGRAKIIKAFLKSS
jgi:mannose-6-phosphate isomerase class I